MSWWDSADAFDREACMGKHRAGTGGMRCHQSYLWTESSYLAHWLTTLWRLAKHSSVKCERQLTCFDCGPLALVPRIDMMEEERQRKWESGVKFLCAQTSKKMTFSTLFREQFSLLALAQSHGGLISAAIPMKGTGLLLCKPWKWSSHTACLCALPGLLPHPDVYSLTAHSY